MKLGSVITTRVLSQDCDLDAVSRICNAAYRCQPGTGRSWTHEGHLIEGDRISPAQLQSELKSANVKLIGAFCGDDLVGSVVVTRKSPLLASVGMLNVEPQLQNFGVGKKLMDAAESVFEVDTLELVVLAKRTELIGWYKKRGFFLVEGKTEQFPIGQGFGHPRPNAFDVYEGVPFFATMEKKLK